MNTIQRYKEYTRKLKEFSESVKYGNTNIYDLFMIRTEEKAALAFRSEIERKFCSTPAPLKNRRVYFFEFGHNLDSKTPVKLIDGSKLP